MFTLPFMTVICNACICQTSLSFFKFSLVFFRVVPILSIMIDSTSPVLHSTWSNLCWTNLLYLILFLSSRCCVGIRLKSRMGRLLQLPCSVDFHPSLSNLASLSPDHFSIPAQSRSSYCCWISLRLFQFSLPDGHVSLSLILRSTYIC